MCLPVQDCSVGQKPVQTPTALHCPWARHQNQWLLCRSGSCPALAALLPGERSEWNIVFRQWMVNMLLLSHHFIWSGGSLWTGPVVSALWLGSVCFSTKYRCQISRMSLKNCLQHPLCLFIFVLQLRRIVFSAFSVWVCIAQLKPLYKLHVKHQMLAVSLFFYYPAESSGSSSVRVYGSQEILSTTVVKL